MSLKPFGALVTALDVERVPEDTGPTHFVRVCGALIRWALVEHGAPSADLRIAERLNVPDRGVDAECTLPDSMIETGGFVGPGRTIFQFKYRSDRHVNISALAGRLRDELARLPVDCDRYVLMTNINLAGTQTSRLRTAILAGAPALATKPVIVWGASEIANALNASPRLRHLFAAAGGLSTVEVAEAELKAAYRRVGWAPLVNRSRELGTLRDFIESETARVLIVRGRRFSGRTRLVIEAVKGSAPLALWAVASEHVDVDLLRDLDSDTRHPLLVVDDDRDAETTQRILDWAEQRQRLKVIVIAQGEPSHQSESARLCLDVPEMEHSDVETFLHSLVPALLFGDRSWLIDGAEGLPGLVAHAALLIPDTRERGIEPDGFRRKLGDLLTEKYESRLSPSERRALQVASVLPIVGVEGSAEFEVTEVAKALGVDPGTFPAHRLALERAGFLRRRGRLVEVVPPMLADHLAARALTNPDRVIAELGVVLSPDRFGAFLERLTRLPVDEIRDAVARILQERCSGFEALLRDFELLRRLAPAAPRAAMRCLEEALKDRTVETLATTLKGDARRALVWTLEDLAYQVETFESAARHLLVLAEAENEWYANNATAVFQALFHWHHPELSASMSQRLAMLQWGALSSAAPRRKLVAEAAGAAFREREVFHLHHARGPRLPEPSSGPETWEQVDRYAQGAIDLLRRLLHDSHAEVRAAAATSLTNAFRPLILISLRRPEVLNGMPSELALKAFEALADAERAAESATTFQAVATALELLLASLPVAARDHPSARRIELQAHQMRGALVQSFRGRLWRLTGPASWGQRREWRHGTAERQHAIEALAREVADDTDYPALFESHLDWLTSTEARSAAELFHALGKADTQRGMLASLTTGTLTPQAQERLSAYLRGWAEVDRDGVEAAVDRLIESRSDLTHGLLGALPTLFRGRDLTERVGRLQAGGGTPRQEFASSLPSLLPWEELDAKDIEHLIRLVDDGTAPVRGAFLGTFTVRLARGTELSSPLRDLAWSFLESSLALDEGPSQPWWDELAAELGKAEPQRLLSLVEGLAIHAAKADQGGITGQFGIPLVFATLQEIDRPGLVRMLLRLSVDPGVRWRLNIEEEIDLLADRNALLAFAREIEGEGARTVALNMSAEKPGFWELTRDLLAEWGGDDLLKQRLLDSLHGGWWYGSALPMIEERLGKAAALLEDSSPWVATWAQNAVSFFNDWRRREARHEQEDWIWEYPIRRPDLEGMVQGPDSPDKLWAIGRLLEHAPQERVRDLLTPEQILQALDKLPQLRERVRERWEAWAKHWAGRH